MFLAILLILSGVLISWQASGVIGGAVLIAGLVKLIFQMIVREPEKQTRNYESAGDRTYTLRSAPKTSRSKAS